MAIPSSTTRQAGVNGTFSVTFSSAPTNTPSLTIYSDAARTQVAVASANLTATANPSVWTAAYPASLAAGTYYLAFSAVYTVGQPAVIDQDDTLVLTAPGANVGAAIVTLAEAKVYLRIPSANVGDDANLQTFIDAVTPVIEDVVGPVAPTTLTEIHDGGTPFIVLRRRPVLSVQGVTEYLANSAFPLTQVASPDQGTLYSYSFESYGRLVRRGPGGTTMAFSAGIGAVSVTYTAGRTTTPANIKTATLELIRHNWQMTQQGGRPAFGQSGAANDAISYTPSGFAIPTRCLEWLQSARRFPSLA